MLLPLFALHLAFAFQGAPGTLPEARTLTLNEGSPTLLQLPCTAGRLVRATVEPDLLQVLLELRDPTGALLAEVRNPLERDEPLPVAAVPGQSGTCTLGLGLASGPPGEVVLRIDPPRPATAGDRTQMEGERFQQDAIRLWAEGSEDSMKKALTTAAQAAALAREAGDVRGEADAHLVAGGVLWQLGELEAAVEEGTRAIELRTRLGDPRALAEALNDRSVFKESLSDGPGALEDLQRAWALADPLPRPALKAQILHNIAFAHHEAKEFERALELYRESQRVAAGSREGPGPRAITLDTIGMVLFDLKRSDEAERQFRQALAIHRATGDRRHQAISLTHLGWVYVDTKRLGEAESAYREAIALLEVTGDRLNLAFARDGLGELLFARGRPEEALAEHRAALRLAREAPDSNQEAISLTNMARALRALGRLEEARDVLAEAVDLTDSGRLRVTGSGRTSFTAQNHDRYELLVSVLWELQRRTPEAARLAEMFWVSERGRARTLLDLLTEARVDLSRETDPELAARQRRLVQEAERISAEAARRTAAGEKVSTEPPGLQRVLNELEDVRAQIRRKNPRSAALIRPEPLRLESVQSRVLDGQTVLLQYLLGQDHSFLFVVTPTTVDVQALPSRGRLEREVRQLTRFWQSPGSDPMAEKRLAARLGRTLLQPALGRIEGKRLAIAADGALHELPFPALVHPRTGKRLVEEHEMLLLPSASAVAAIRASARPEQHAGTVAVLADPIFDRRDPRVQARTGSASLPVDLRRSLDEIGLRRLERLPGTRREAEGILGFVPPERALAALGFEARRARAMDPEVGRYRILHFATHGLLNSQHPELSGLVLSLVDRSGEPQNGFLRLQDVYGMRIGADLVVLSACQTALGKQVRGEGVLGLTRGFIHAGARQVLASLWRVSDRATAELMRELYRAMLVEGRPPAAALRQAQRKLAGTRSFAAPFAWAAFVVEGDWDQSSGSPSGEGRR